MENVCLIADGYGALMSKMGQRELATCGFLVHFAFPLM